MQRQFLIEGHLLQVHDFDVVIVSLDRAREQDVSINASHPLRR
jgi:hypothetical protein